MNLILRVVLKLCKPTGNIQEIAPVLIDVVHSQTKITLGMGIFLKPHIIQHSKRFFHQKAHETFFKILNSSNKIVGKKLLLLLLGMLWDGRILM